MNKHWYESFGIDSAEFLPGEPSVWIDLLATLIPGIIKQPTVEKQIKLHAIADKSPQKLIDSTINKCIKDGWLLRIEDGTMYISNWDRLKYKN